ncbi:MAG: hypothetical protein ACJAVI_002439 [Candidatus Azotimanducaceae bacterium]
MLLTGLFVLAVMIFVTMRILLAKQNLSLRSFFIFYALAVVGVALIYLGVTGRLHWLFVLAGSALPFSGTILRWGLRFWRTAAFLKGLRGLKRKFGQTQGATKAKSTGQTSEVNTSYIRMVLDHDTGHISGQVVNGRFSGSELSNLAIAELKELYYEIAGDTDSTNVLEAYLDREQPQWRDGDGETGETQHSLTEQEALEILGLEQGASKEDIKLAHRRIIQKLHPDRGGSTFLASQVNEAKDLLLKK